MRTDPNAQMDGDAQELLVSFTKRLINIDNQLDALKQDRADLLKEVRGRGFDRKLFQESVKRIRGQDVEAFRKSVAIMDQYLDTMLADFETLPLGMAAANARDSAAQAH